MVELNKRQQFTVISFKLSTGILFVNFNSYVSQNCLSYLDYD